MVLLCNVEFVGVVPHTAHVARVVPIGACAGGAAAMRPLPAMLLVLSCAVVAAGRPSGGALLVVGSVNVDTTVRVDHLPHLGETVVSSEPASVAVGGKGANQAVAVARLQLSGAPKPRFVARFGTDAHEAWLRRSLLEAGVDLSGCTSVATLSTGQGIVLLDADGAATSVVLGGANEEGWSADDAELHVAAQALTLDAAALLLQREVPQRVNEAFAAAAAARGVPVLLDAGGEAGALTRALTSIVDYLCPNESELARLTGMPTDTDAHVVHAAAALQRTGARNVLVTLGERGALLVLHNGTVLRQQPLPLPGGMLVDATAAGDAFRAAFAVSLVEKQPLPQCMLLGAAAGAIAATRIGAMPSLPSRQEVQALLRAERTPPAAEVVASAHDETQTPSASLPETQMPLQSCAVPSATAPDAFPLRFASRLNSMASRRDLVGGAANADDALGWVSRQSRIRGLSLVDFNYPQHLKGLAPQSVLAALSSAGLAAGSVCTRFPALFRGGAFSTPNDSLRAQALQLAVQACDWASSLGASQVVVWSPFDGYDYHLAADYTHAWARSVGAFQALTDACAVKNVRVSIEWKPSDPSTRWSFVPSTAAALLLAGEVNRSGFGVTLDTGHLLLAGENPAQSLAMAAAAGKLFGVQLSDAHVRLGAEDGLAFGTVNAAAALETVFWLRRSNYSGHVYFDTFPLNEDPVREAELNIRRFKALWHRAGRLQEKGISELMAAHDAMGVLELLESDALESQEQR